MSLLFIILAILAALLLVGITLVVAVSIVRQRALEKRALDIHMVQVLLPKDLDPQEREEGVGEDIKERIAVGEQWLSTLTNLPIRFWDKLLYGRPTFVLEMVGRSDGTIGFYVGTERRFLDHLEKQLYALYPEAEVKPAAEYTIFEEGDTTAFAQLRLARANHLPHATYKELEADPIQSLTGALAKLQNGDAAVIQFVCRSASERTRRKARKAAKRTVMGRQSDIGSAGQTLKYAADHVLKSPAALDRQEAASQKLTPRSEERVQLVEHKLSQPQFAVNIRVAVATRQPEDTERVMNAITGAFSQYELPDLNAFTVIQPKARKRALHNLIWRIPDKRSANTLSTTELTSLFHFPLATTATPNIAWRGAKVAPIPPEAPTKGVHLGNNVYRGVTTHAYLAPDDRRRHLYLVGQTGTGKTTLFLNLITQDIAAGHGVGVIDPHGDLIEDILLRIPPERADDVILFDPKDVEQPLGFNILESKDPAQRDLIVNEVVQVLQKLAARLNPESVGPMFEHYLRNALAALAEDPNATLIDVPRMFVDEAFRKEVLQRNPDPTVRQFWEQEYAQSQRGQMSADMLSYVVSKLGRFIGNEVVRNVIGQPQSSFDVREVMDQRKILLCNLSKGQLGDINADLLGFVLVSKIQIAALGRANVPEDQRPDFYFYLDEFQNFTTDSISTILSEARKYRLNLNLTHQFIEQLDDDIKEAVFGNVGTIISYRVGVEDAEFLQQQFQPVFSDYDLVNLERFTAYTRLLASGTPLRPFSLKIPPPPAAGDPATREAIRKASRASYGRSKAEVEKLILNRFATTSGTSKPKPSSGDDDYLSESLFDIS